MALSKRGRGIEKQKRERSEKNNLWCLWRRPASREVGENRDFTGIAARPLARVAAGQASIQ
jgi:hypothetical protein